MEFMLAFAAAMTAICAGTWLKAKSLQLRRIEDGETSQNRMRALAEENRNLHEKVAHVEDRLTVLERIVTDPAERTAREIELLR